jgi:hypothetical protein
MNSLLHSRQLGQAEPHPTLKSMSHQSTPSGMHSGPPTSTDSAKGKKPVRTVKADAACWAKVLKHPPKERLLLGGISFVKILIDRYRPFMSLGHEQLTSLSSEESERIREFRQNIRDINAEILYAEQQKIKGYKDCVNTTMDSPHFTVIRKEIKRSLTRIIQKKLPEVEDEYTGPWFMKDKYREHCDIIEEHVKKAKERQEKLWGKRQNLVAS